MRLAHLRCRIFGHCWSLYVPFVPPVRQRRILAEHPTRNCLRCGVEEAVA